MARPRTGSAWKRPDNAQYEIAISLREKDERGRSIRWFGICPPRADGVPLDITHARKVARELQRMYEQGKWTPPSGSDSPTVPIVDSPTTVLQHAQAWIKTQKYSSAADDVHDIDTYIAASPIAEVPVSLVRPRHVLEFIEWMAARPSRRGGTLAARSVRNTYSILRRVLDDAVIRELLVANPCAVVRGKLPKIADKTPGARESWRFNRDEVERLISDPRVPPDRRVVYATLFLTGCRPGELSALRFKNWDRATKPLARISIVTAVHYRTREEKATKTQAYKRVPVHPTLARILAEWKLSGWQAHYGRAPNEDDFIVPTRDGRPRKADKITRMIKRDCRVLGISAAHFAYCTRHTFISIIQDDDGDANVAQWITHAPPRTSFGGYTQFSWSKLCAEMMKLRIELRAPVVLELKAAANTND